ncbi:MULTISPECIES: SDR family oxidoreductase [Rhodococcus]|uniref:SDR family oxidoreductase n=1 Tax=Rhodococcus TaxID=1827 RepID=UPI001C594FB7|nr:SDR family oxidoreductase [Rhodococcus sp. LW-XY12]QXU55582.1 SDR family oxidoreductase [Rhodococcus sp. LW-XY12]
MRIVISGSSSGLGAALSHELAGRGHTVFGCSTRPASAACEQIDVANRDAVTEWARRSAAAPFDVVIANAAVAVTTKPATEITAAELRHVLDVNVIGVFNLFTAFQPYTTEGCVYIAMSSQWGIHAPRPGQAAYCASKFAVEGFVSAWRQEIGARQRVYALDPGAGIGTAMMDVMTPSHAWPGDPDPADEWAVRAASFITHLEGSPQGPLHVRVPTAAESQC